MLVKVCGLKDINQIKILENSKLIDLLGFIYYKESKRYFEGVSPEVNSSKVAVFVNEDFQIIEEKIEKEKFEYLQLHGDETPEFVKSLKSKYPLIKMIKAFGIDSDFDFNKLNFYEGIVDFFLFDTKSKGYGGTGIQFDWELLNNYQGKTPFILSGGLKAESLEQIKNIKHKQFIGIDLNSGFEHLPGDKNVNEILKFCKEIKNGN